MQILIAIYNQLLPTNLAVTISLFVSLNFHKSCPIYCAPTYLVPPVRVEHSEGEVKTALFVYNVGLFEYDGISCLIYVLTSFSDDFTGE